MAAQHKKCFIYLRVSTSMQVEGYSLDAQKERLLKFADFQELEVVREYCDAGKSGKSITGRPEFQRMLKDIAEGEDEIDFVLVFKLSRFGRNAADVLNSLQYIQDFGVNLICVEDGIDSSKESGKLTITVLSAVAEIERENILVQTMEGRKQKAREGQWNGGLAPFGYRIDRDHNSLAVVPEEAEIVKIIFHKYVDEGMGFDSISDYLNTRGYTKKKQRKSEVDYFKRTTVKNIIDNPVYMGKIAYGRRAQEKVKGTRDQYRRICADEYMLYDGKHEAIIDEQLWNEAAARRKQTGVRNEKRYSCEHAHILSGLIVCPVCGHNLSSTIFRSRHNKDVPYKDYFYYRCQHRHKIDDEHFCNYAPLHNQETMNQAVEQIIFKMHANEELKGFILDIIEKEVDVDALKTEHEQLKGQLRQTLGAKNKLTQMLDQLDVTDKHYNRKYQDMQDRLDNLYDKVDAIERSMKDVKERIQGAQSRQISAKQICTILSEFDKLYYQMTDMEKKEFMQSFIRSIELYPEGEGKGRIIRRINFKFPVCYGDGEEGETIMLGESTVETVCLLGNRKYGRKPDATINISLDMKEYYEILDRKAEKANSKRKIYSEGTFRPKS